MRNACISLFCVIILFVSCGEPEKSPREKALENIKSWQTKADSTIQKNENVVGICDSLIKYYENFVNAYPTDTFAPECLQRIASLHQRLRNFEKAQLALNRFCKMFPSDKKVPFIMFQEAMMLQTEMNQLGKAKDLFQQIIQKFPNTKWAGEAQIMMSSNATNDMELFQERVLNNKNNQATKK